ncbi:uncharacterized protein SCHCODRAFT_02732849, partial [Schizophyllum commune H4-8]|uniref:uncharacterized protein n=1 Tax=Schizophyllum commune (strain H4-8 / FGSC 9210) TaxID=578458 RepID=UPI00215F6EF3
ACSPTSCHVPPTLALPTRRARLPTPRPAPPPPPRARARSHAHPPRRRSPLDAPHATRNCAVERSRLGICQDASSASPESLPPRWPLSCASPVNAGHARALVGCVVGTCTVLASPARACKYRNVPSDPSLASACPDAVS